MPAPYVDVGAASPKEPAPQFFRGVLPCVPIQVVGLALLSRMPEVVTIVPNLMGG